MKLIAQNTTGNVAALRILDDAGVPRTGVAYNAAGLAVWFIPEGGTPVQITLTSGNWTETKFGEYEVDVPDAAYQTVQTVRIVGSLTDSVVIPDRHQVFSSIWTSLPSAATIATAVIEKVITGSQPAGSLARFIRDIKQADVLFEGTIVTATSDTATLNGDATTVCVGQAISIGEEGDIERQTRFVTAFDPAAHIVTLDRPWCVVPSDGASYQIKTQRNPLVGRLSTYLADSFGSVLYSLSTMIEYVGSVWRWKATSLSQSPQPTAEVIHVPTPNVNGNLVLTQGDTYDGIGNPKAQWEVERDYTSGWSVTLTIRDKDDAVVYTTVGEVVSDELIAVTIETPEGLEMEGCPGQWQGKFDVELTKASSVQTIAVGVCYINEDQTR